MTTFMAVFTGTQGKTKPDRISITQNSTETPVVLDCYNADGTAYIFAAGDVASASFADNSTGEVYAVTGTITPAVGASALTWARSAEDVGTPAVYTISFKVVSTVPKTDKTIPVTYTVVPVPDGVLVPPSPLVGVSAEEAAWLTVAVATVPSASDLITAADVAGKADKIIPATVGDFAALDATGNLTDSGSAAGDFDAAGSAAAVAGDLTTHEGLTGTAVHGLGTMATEAATDFVAVTGDDMTGKLAIETAGGTGQIILTRDGRPGGVFIRESSQPGAEDIFDISANQVIGVNGGTTGEAGVGFRFDTRAGQPRMSISTRQAGDAYQSALEYARFTVSDSGDVGINETTPTASLHVNGNVKIMIMKSGATQAAAGAAAGELWRTIGHATDSDNTVKYGV